MVKILISIILFFSISAHSGGLMMQAPIKEQLQYHQRDKCEKKIEYYQKRVREYPGNEYYKWLQKKWTQRCEKKKLKK